MNIIYTPNPLCSKVELNVHERQAFWYQVKIEQLKEMLYDVHFSLKEQEMPVSQDSLVALQNKIILDDFCEDSGSDLDRRVDGILEEYVSELQFSHCGDCTCVAASCMKCHAERVLGIDTIPGLGKHSANKIQTAFKARNKEIVTLDEALDRLLNYDPVPADPHSDSWKRLGGYEQYVPKWRAEAKQAYDWLLQYKLKHFS